MSGAAPRRGKFLSAPSSSPSSSAPDTPSSQSRGKFLGKKPAPSPSAAEQSASSFGSNTGDSEHNSLDSLRAHVKNSKIAAVSRRRAIAGQRQAVLDNLDKAENIVLSLLDCASDVAGALSDMTSAKSKKRHGQKKEGNDERTFEEFTSSVRANGDAYLAGVKSLHSLLSPHASLVKSYKNHDAITSTNDESKHHKSLAAALPSSTGGTNSTSSKVVEEATTNMYAVRVEQRLANERTQVLREMIRLEEEEQCTINDDDGDIEGVKNTNAVGSKRKHE